MAVELRKTKIAVIKPGWDYNWDSNGIEVVDENQVPYFQIDRIGRRLVTIKGLFLGTKGRKIALSDGGMNFGINSPVKFPHITKIFAYPSRGNLHKRVATPPLSQ